MRSRLLLLLVVLLPCVACDQATKLLAIEHLRHEEPVRWLGGAVTFVFAENRGAFLGLGGGLPADLRQALFIGGTSLMLLGMAAFVWRKRDLAPAGALGIALIVAGGAGNWVDRVARRGKVVDFVQFRAGPVATGVFNAADVFIVAGALLAIGALGRTPRRDDEATPAV